MNHNKRRVRQPASLLAALLALTLATRWPDNAAQGQGLPAFPDSLSLDDQGLALDLVDFDVPFAQKIAVPAGTAEITAPFQVGSSKSGATLTLLWAGGKKKEIVFKVGDALYQESVPGDDARTIKRTLPEACVKISPLKIEYFVRPNPVFYSDRALQPVRRDWNTFPSPVSHAFLLSLQIDDDGVVLSLDGNYVGRIKQTGRLEEIVIPLPGEAKATFIPHKAWTPWSRLDLRSLNRPGAMKNAKLHVKENRLAASGAPLRMPADGASSDVGCVQNVSPPNKLDTFTFARYHERSAFEGMREALLMSVPIQPYTRAWVLCASEDHPTKETAFNVRLTRFRPGGIGNAMVNTRVDVPLQEESDAPTMQCVGHVTYESPDGEKSVPLWLAEVAVNSSEIQDVLYADWPEGRLDFELMGLDRNSKSGVHVFAVTLEQSPVEMEVKQVIQGSVFHNEEQPEMKVALRPLSPANVTLRWTVQDVWGNDVATEARSYSFAKGDAPQELSVPLKMKEFGWYQVVFSLEDGAGRPLLSHTAAYAQLPTDTRKAGYESPFGCWWQPYGHSHMTDPDVVGPLLFKAGIRRTTGTAQSEAVMKPWKVTVSMVPWFGGYRYPGAPVLTMEEWQAEYGKRVDEHMKNFPNTGLAMIFHESYNSAMAAEVWGDEPDPLSAFGHVEKAKYAGAFLREKYPDLKIIIGNSGWSGALMSQLLRGGLPLDLIDGLGMERLIGYFAKDTMPPERHEASWTSQKSALMYGCTAPPTDCVESGGRGNYGMSQRTIAEYVVRDSLVGFAWNYLYIGVGVVSENVNGYYHTRWGGDSILRRSPLLYPEPQYVAIATMTRLLDQVKLLRRVPTGSHTAYAQEYARGTERVYTLWTPRGTCDMALTFPANTAITVTGLYGKACPVNLVDGKLHIEASEEVTYVTASAAASAVLAGARAFPLDDPPTDAIVVAPLDDLGAWDCAQAKALDQRPYPYGWLPWRSAGKGTLSAATDPEKGACLQVGLIPEGEITEMLDESLSIQATAPIPVPGEPTTIGVWMKGNSSWGRVFFEIIDAEGERFRGGEYEHEPWGTSYINFDGWCFVTLPLSSASPIRKRFYYPPSRLWKSNGGNGKIDYPIRVTGISVTLKRKTLDLAKMEPTEPFILLKDLTVYGGSKTTTTATAPKATTPKALTGPTVKKMASNVELYSDADLRYLPIGANPLGFATDSKLKEENGLRFISCEKGTKDLFRNLQYYGANSWLDYEWTFRFRFPDAEKIGFNAMFRTKFAPSPFFVMPARGPEDKSGGVSLDVTAQGFDPSVVGGIFQMARGSTWAAKGLPPLEAGRWYRITLRAAGRALDISLEHEGKQVNVYRGPIPAAGGGVNLSSPHPIDVADIRIKEVVATTEDWNHAGRIRVENESPVPGEKSHWIDGPFMISDAIRVPKTRPCLLSAFIRTDREGVFATLQIGSKTKQFPVSKEWKRYSFVGLPPQESAENYATCSFTIKGSDEGPIWISAPRVEFAPIDPTAHRAEGWERTVEADYEIDSKVFHQGKFSMRSMPDGTCLAVQEVELEAEEFRPILLDGWCRTEGEVKRAEITLELFRDRLYWTPKNEREVEPRETFVLEFKPNAHDWARAQSRIEPLKAFKRYRMTVAAEGSGGKVWFDDLALRLVGAAGAPALGGSLNTDRLGAPPIIGGANDSMALLDLLGDESGSATNLLINASFEKPMTNGIVTLASDKPSPIGPTKTPTTWMKAD